FGIIGIGLSFGIATSLDYWLNFICIKYYFHRKGFKGSPYREAGRLFGPKILLLNISSFVVCLAGVWLIKHFLAQIQVNFLTALLTLAIGGMLLLAIFVLTIRKAGPAHLQNLFLAKFPK